MNTPSILKKIVNKKIIRIEQEKALLNLSDMKALADKAAQKNSFYDALAKDGLSIIGEIKKASPSKGLIKKDFDPIAIANEYKNCVDALSVLTEADFFLGSFDYLSAVSKTVDLPILCKDFIIDEYQIYKAKAIGASAVLLIVSILDVKTIKNFLHLSKSLGLDALVETHDTAEATTAIETGADIIGVNNRDLHTFNVDLKTTVEVSKIVGNDKILVSESGIHTKEDIIKIKEANIKGILVGESFMKCDDISAKAKEFKDAYKN